MGIVCCAISGVITSFMYFCEKCAACFAATILVTCLVATLLITLGLGIGLGYNYCFVDMKTRYRYIPPHFRVVPGYGQIYKPTPRYWNWGTTSKSMWGKKSKGVPPYGYPGEIRVTPFPGDKPKYYNPEIIGYPYKSKGRVLDPGYFYGNRRPPYLRRAGIEVMYGPETVSNAGSEIKPTGTVISKEYPSAKPIDNTDTANNKIEAAKSIGSTNIRNSLQDYSDIMVKKFHTEISTSGRNALSTTALFLKFLTKQY